VRNMGTTETPEQANITPAVLIAALVVLLLILVAIVVYCTCKQREEIYRRNSRRTTGVERKRQYQQEQERNSREGANLIESNRSESLIGESTNRGSVNGFSHEAYYPTMNPKRQNSYISSPNNQSNSTRNNTPGRVPSRNNFTGNASTVSDSTILSPSQLNGPVIRNHNRRKHPNNSDQEDIKLDL
jgi:hypothetical protein